jgi:signal transduction histidine kinase
MKLFTKYNRISILATILVFLAGCVAFYFVLRYVLLRQLDESLHTEQTEIIAYVNEHNELPEVVNAYNQQITFSAINGPLPATTFFSQKYRNAKENELEWSRKLTFGITAAGKNYLATVSKSQMETEDMLQLVIIIGAGMIALILLAGYGINRLVIKRLWKPFYKTIYEVEHYQLAKQRPIQLAGSGISEFDLLNHRLTAMTEKAQKDYTVVKEFSANAAHEMQTPLAVIQTNTEALMQDEQLLQQHNGAIQTIEQSVRRLTRLNQALLLLARIENRQFIVNETIQLDEIVKEKTEELAELMASQKIAINSTVEPVSVSFNRHLAEVMISNLVNNAIRYNKEGGTIIIELTPKHFTISNTSVLPPLEPGKISHRFYRHPDTRPDGNGLGLSIVNQVCEMAGYTLRYYHHNGLHVFSITLKTA